MAMPYGRHSPSKSIHVMTNFIFLIVFDGFILNTYTNECAQYQTRHTGQQWEINPNKLENIYYRLIL